MRSVISRCRPRPGARRIGWLGLGALLVICSAGAGDVHADRPRQDDATVASTEQELAERFVPVMMLKEQPEPCDPEGEPYGPTSVEILLGNPEIALRQVSGSDPVVVRGPTAADLAGLGEGFFLDFPGSSLSPGCIYERDFDKYAADRPATVYAHVVPVPDEGLVFVQYWFYWYYNDWNNKHESDWEGITLKFEAASVEEALASEPVAVGYSQHEGGERADWDDAKLERDGDRPVVYSSAGSHASYFGSALYLGRAASEGFGCDDTSGPSRRVDPEVVVLPDAVDDPADPLAWLSYDGRWGERQSGAFNGPTGPAVKDRWLDPAPWFEELRSSSVVIPSGDTQAAEVIDVFCGAVERGSRTLITFTVSPARVVIGFLLLALLVSFLARRTKWDNVEETPIVRRRRAGQIFRAAGGIYTTTPLAFIAVGLVYLPAAVVTGLLSALISLVPFVSSLLSLAGGQSGTSIVLAAFVGSLANVAAFVFVNAVVADYLRREAGGTQGALDAVRATWERRRDLADAFLRSFVIVFVLLASVIGIPWGIRQLVRYQFIGQAVMADGCDGRRALQRSSELVRGRWFHTAIVTAGLNGGVGLIVLFVSLLLLIIAAGLPIWLFSALVSLVYAIAVPLAAIAMTLLHGDAVAQLTSAPRAQPVLVD